MRPSNLAIAFGVGRVVIGAALIAAPGRVAGGWIGSDDPPTHVLARCLGARDIVLGAGLVAAVAHDRDPGTWLAGSVLADAADATATLAAGDHIPRFGRLGTTALAGGSALFGAWLASAID
jgi:hypothetical protein